EPALPARHHVQMDTVAAVLDRQERDQDDRHALVAGFAVRRADLGRGRVPRSDAPAPAADLCGVAVEAHVHRLQGPLASSRIISPKRAIEPRLETAFDILDAAGSRVDRVDAPVVVVFKAKASLRGYGPDRQIVRRRLFIVVRLGVKLPPVRSANLCGRGADSNPFRRRNSARACEGNPCQMSVLKQEYESAGKSDGTHFLTAGFRIGRIVEFQPRMKCVLNLGARHSDTYRSQSGGCKRPRRRGREQCQDRHLPPISRTTFHSSSRTGATDRRDWRISSIFESRGSALISASVTGRGRGFTGSTRTDTQSGSFGSGCASRVMRMIPTTALSDMLW